MACKFFWNNLWKDYSITETSEHERFPAENTQHRDFNKAWRSNYGAGSGWGNFLIVDAENDRLDFEDFGTTIRVAAIVPGEYTAEELAAHIEAQMDATASADTFTVEYLESSNKFKITDDAGIFELLWNSGPNSGRSIATTIGFDDSADDIGVANYTADDLRIHSEERITIDFGAATNIYAVIIRGHNFSASATVKAEFSADNFATVASTTSFTVQDDILALEWDAAKNYQYARVWIRDRENSDLYVSMGVVFIGGHFQPTNTFLEESQYTPADPSVLNQSEDGQYSSIQLSHYRIKGYGFIMGSSDKSTLESVFVEVGTTRGLFFTEDTSSYLTTTNYVKLNSFQFQSLLHSTGVWRLDVEMEKLR